MEGKRKYGVRSRSRAGGPEIQNPVGCPVAVRYSDLRFQVSGKVLWSSGEDVGGYAPKTTRILDSRGGVFTYLGEEGRGIWEWGDDGARSTYLTPLMNRSEYA